MTLRDVPDQLADFGVELRAAGVRVGPADAADAARVLALVDWTERDALRGALAATLAKSHADRGAFDAVFERFFFRTAEEQARAAGEPAGDGAPDAPLAPQTRPGADRVPAEPFDADALRAELLTLLDAGDEGALADLAVLSARFVPFAGVGALIGAGAAVARLRGQLGLPERTREWHRRLREGAEGDEAERLRGRLDRLAGFEAILRRELERRRFRETGRFGPGRPGHQPHLEELSFAAASPAELRELGRAVAPLAKKLAARLVRAGRPAGRPGRPNFRATMRRSLETGGVPIRVVDERRAPTKPALAILCDVSSSVAASTAFTIQLVYALQERFRRVRSFAFVERCDEVTEYFTPGVDLRAAVRRMNREAKVTAETGRSDYGRSIAELAERYPDAVDSRTTLLIVGDARANFHAPRAEVLAELTARARRSYWLNPEPRNSWDTGDSVMRAYRPLVTATHEVRTLRDLAAWVGTVS